MAKLLPGCSLSIDSAPPGALNGAHGAARDEIPVNPGASRAIKADRALGSALGGTLSNKSLP